MNFEQISNLTIESTFMVLIYRLLDVSTVDPKKPIYMLDKDTSKSFYDRVLMNEKLVKPSLTVLNTELDEYKAELIAIEQARLDEIVRVEVIKSRFEAIEDIRGAIFKAQLDISNPAIELERIIRENDQDRLQLLEQKHGDWAADQLVSGQKESRKDIGRKIRACCDEVLDVVVGHNVERDLTSEQKNMMAATFAPIMQALMGLRPALAKQAISAAEPDGILVTGNMKNEILDVFTKYGV